MQLPLSADVLVPIGVGVLVAVVAVIALVIGLRRKVEDAPTPTYADWTSEHVGDVVVPPTRTVADAVAERQGNTGPFLVVAPAQPGGVEAGCAEAAESAGAARRNGNGVASRRAAPLSSLAPVVSASVVARQRHAVQASGGTALAEPGEVAAGVEPEPKSTAVEGSAADTALRAQAGHPGSGGGDDRPPFPADPLFGAGRFDQIGPDGDPWFTPPAMPRTQLGGSDRPTGPDEGAAESQAGEQPVAGCPEPAADPSAGASGGEAGAATWGATQSEPTTAAGSTPAAPHAAGNGPKPAPEPQAPAHRVTSGPPPEPAPHAAAGLPEPVPPTPAHQAPGAPGSAQPTPARFPAAGMPDPAQANPTRRPAAGPPEPTQANPTRHQAPDVPEPGQAIAGRDPVADGPAPGPKTQTPTGHPSAGMPEPASTAPPPEPHSVVDVPGSAPTGSAPAHEAAGDSAQPPPSQRRQAAPRSDGPASPPEPPSVANVPQPASAPEDGAAPTRYPVVNVPEPALAPDRHPVVDEPAPSAGSSHSVAAAVAQVLAARAAAHAPEGDRRGDARDRLLAVLLDDPMRAVGATVDLQDCQERLDRLAASLQDERGRLGDVLGRLARSGLRPDQLARLSGLSDTEVAELLRRGPSA